MYNRIIGFVGPTGSGKSYLAAQAMAQHERCAVIQLKRLHEEPAFAMSCDEVFDGDLNAFVMSLAQSQFKVVYLCQPPQEDDKKIDVPDFEWFVKACYTRENMLMVVDEAHFFCDARHMPLFFRQAVVMGRSRYLDIIWIAQKFSTVSKELTANSHEMYIWRLNEPGDLESLSERAGRDVSEAVQNLRPSDDQRRNGGEFIPGQYIHWYNDGHWEVIDPCKTATKPSESTGTQSPLSSSSDTPPTSSSDGSENVPPVASVGSASTDEHTEHASVENANDRTRT